MLFTHTHQISVRALAFLTLLSMLISFVPVQVFTAEAAVSTATIEVMPNPDNGVGDGNGEWFRITNNGADSLDITGWSVTDEQSFNYVFGSVILAASESYTVCANDDSGQNGGVSCDDEWSGGSVWNNAAAGDTLTLFDATPSQVDAINYTNPADEQIFSTTFDHPSIVLDPECDTEDTLSNTTFDTFNLGSVDTQNGWSSTGSFDQEIVENTYGYDSFGCKTLRISNAVTNGSFGDQTFSASLSDEAGEEDAENGGLSGGTRYNHFEAEWDFASADPDDEQPGLNVTISPDRGDGARMSWINLADTPSGLEVNFYDYALGNTVDNGPCNCAPFRYTTIASGLDRTVPHTLKVEMDFFGGPDDDVVRVYIDGALVHTGTSWEDYFRDSEGNPTRTVDSLLFRVSGAEAPGTSGKGFLFDNMSLELSDLTKSSNEVEVSGDTSAGENQPGWLFNRDANNATPIQFNEDEASIGIGSLYVEPLTSEAAKKFIGEYFLLDEIANIEEISYDFLIGSGGTAADENEFYLNVYANYGESASDKYYDCKYDVVPTIGSTADFTTVTFDPTQSYPVTKRGDSPYICPSVPADMDLKSPGSTIRMFAINMGDTTAGDENLDGYFDNVVVETNTEITTFDFEPADEEKPVINVVEPTVNYLTNSDFDITVHATDNKELSKIVVNLKDGDNSAHIGTCANESVSGTSATTTCTVDISELPNGDGDYYFRTNAKDADDNLSNTISQKFTVDTTPPTITVKDGAASDDTYTEVSFKLFDQYQVDKLTLNGVEKDLTNNKWSDLNYVSPGSFGAVLGENTLVLYDVNGNTSTYTFYLVVDTEKPNVTIETPDDGSVWPTGTIHATGTAWDVDSDIEEVKYTVTQIDGIGGAYVANVDSGDADGEEEWEFEVDIDTPGYYRFKVQAFDEAGNWRYKYHDIEVKELVACTIVSDTNTVVVENNDYAVETYTHKNWTASIPGAAWIWETFHVMDPEVETTKTFKETFTVSDLSDAVLDIATDNTYRVYINDVLAAESTNSNNFQEYIGKKQYDVTSYISEGENTLRIEVTNLGTDNSTYASNPAGALYKLVVNTTGGSCSVTTEPDTYTLSGYKYEATDGGSLPYEGWAIYASNGTTTLDTVTDSDGYYYFNVEDLGEWEVYEDMPDGWNQVGVYQNGVLLDNDEEESCAFDVTYDSETGYECDFYNQAESVTSVTTTGGGGGGGGTTSFAGTGFLSRNGGPDARVLGASTSTESCEQYLQDTIRPGAANDPEQVTKIQKFLNDVVGHNLVVNGVYDSATIAAVIDFQAKYSEEILAPWGLVSPTGIVYYTTRKLVNEMYCEYTESFPLSATEKAEIEWYRNLAYSGREETNYSATQSDPDNSSGNDGSSEPKQESGESEQSEDSFGFLNSDNQEAGVGGSGVSFWQGIGNFFSNILSR